MKNLENILSHSDCLSQEQMQLYLENKLEQEDMHAVESHITDCMFCSDALEGLQTIEPNQVLEQVEDIKAHFESLFAEEDEEKVAAPISTESVSKPLQASKGGKNISWKAAAGLFFLIFAGGLAVFSYIKDNNGLFGNKKEQYSINEKSSGKDFESEKSKISTPELESVTLDASDLPATTSEESKKISRKSKTEAIAKEQPNYKIKEIDNQLARNDVSEEEVPAAPSVAKPRYKALPKKEVQASTTEVDKLVGASVANEKREEKSKEIIAKTDRLTENPNDLSSSNTYTQPQYQGKLKNVKDINQAPAVSKVSANKKGKKKTSKYSQESEMADIDIVQSRGLQNGATYGKLDNYTKGYNAYQQKDYKQSIKYLKKALRQKDLKNRDDVLYQLAMAYEKSNNQSKAEAIYAQLQKKAPYKSRALNGLKRVRSKK